MIYHIGLHRYIGIYPDIEMIVTQCDVSKTLIILFYNVYYTIVYSIYYSIIRVSGSYD